MRRAVEVEPEQAAERLAQRELQRQRLVGGGLVHPEGNDCEERDRGGCQGDACDDHVTRRRVARAVEIMTARNEQHEHDRRRERAVVQPVQHVQGGRGAGDDRCHLPRPLSPSCQPAGRDKQRDGRERARGAREWSHRVRGERVQEAVVVSGQDRVHEIEDGADGDDRRDEQRSPPSAAPRGRECGDGERDERGGQVDRLHSRRRVERVAEGDLADNGDRDAGLEVAEEADADAEQECRREPLEAGATRVEAERDRRDEPDSGEPEKRCRAVLRELVERQRLADPRAGQRRPDEVEPAGRGERRRDENRERSRAYACSLRESASSARAALPRQSAQL